MEELLRALKGTSTAEDAAKLIEAEIPELMDDLSEFLVEHWMLEFRPGRGRHHASYESPCDYEAGIWQVWDGGILVADFENEEGPADEGDEQWARRYAVRLLLDDHRMRGEAERLLGMIIEGE